MAIFYMVFQVKLAGIIAGNLHKAPAIDYLYHDLLIYSLCNGNINPVTIPLYHHWENWNIYLRNLVCINNMEY